MVLRLAQYLLISFYAALPAVMLIQALVLRQRQRRTIPLISFLLLCIVGTAAGAGFLSLDRRVTGGRLPAWEIARLIYFSIAIVLTLKLLDQLLLRSLLHLARVKLNAGGRPAVPGRWRVLAVLAVQRLLLLAIALPYVLSILMTYRPKVLLAGDPRSSIHADFATVRFYARDGVVLAGWWIPALRAHGNDADAESHRAQRTVIVCHGVGSGKEDELGLASFLINNDFNVFLFDFRGCGESGGAFVTYGDRERLDVLAAIDWIKANHQRESLRLCGIGSNTGAAALLGAATEPEGAAIDAIVLYEPFARLRPTASAALKFIFPPPVNWLVQTVGLPLASIHCGCDLLDFAPADEAYRLWPRPALVVHGRGTTFVPVWQEMELYQQLLQPKSQFWPAEAYGQMREKVLKAGDDSAMLTEMFKQWIGTSGRISEDQGVREATLRFLKDAQAVPVL